MKRILTSTATILVLAFPAGAMAEETAPTPKQNAAKTCKALKAATSAADFKAMFNAKNESSAYGKCVSKQAKVESANASNASKQCKAEAADPNFAATHDGKTFTQFYGTGKAGKNAHGKCVSSKAKAANAAETKAQVKAVKACKAERKELGKAAFTAKYGGKKNAYGKCVSAEAKARS